MFPPAASGGASFLEKSLKVIRLARHGCTNRPFYHIVVMENFADQLDPVIEQVGTYDPLSNYNNEKLVAFNYERITHWIGRGAKLSGPVAELLGLSGYFPIHPRSYMNAWRKRDSLREELHKITAEMKANKS